MQLVSVNAALPQELTWEGKTIHISIFKQPVAGPADRRVRGGPDKAVYAYAREHYDAYWQLRLPGTELRPGAFAENLTTAGLLKADVRGRRLLPGGHSRAVGRVAPPALPEAGHPAATASHRARVRASAAPGHLLPA